MILAQWYVAHPKAHARLRQQGTCMPLPNNSAVTVPTMESTAKNMRTFDRIRAISRFVVPIFRRKSTATLQKVHGKTHIFDMQFSSTPIFRREKEARGDKSCMWASKCPKHICQIYVQGLIVPPLCFSTRSKCCSK